MPKLLISLFLFIVTNSVCGQTYDTLDKMQGVSQTVYYSKNSKPRAEKIFGNVAKAESFFEEAFKVKANYTLLVLDSIDWKTYAHPQAIYGIPHYLPDGRLVVASQNNDFWKRNTPPMDKLSPELAKRLKDTYGDATGEIDLTNFFDLLAIHELGHAFQKAARSKGQRRWLSELTCNILLHTFVSEKAPFLLPALTTFPEVTVAGFPAERLKFTTLEDFETNYNVIAQQHPDNYGWYQCRFHTVAGIVYNAGGVEAMNKLWNAILAQKEKLDNAQLNKLLSDTHPALKNAIEGWSK